MMLMLVVSTTALAEVKTWSHVWDTSKSNGGEGFYHISNNADTVQTTMLKKLEWTYRGNTSVTAFLASTGQYFGSAKSWDTCHTFHIGIAWQNSFGKD